MNNIRASHIILTENCEGCRCESVRVTGKTKVEFIKIC